MLVLPESLITKYRPHPRLSLITPLHLLTQPPLTATAQPPILVPSMRSNPAHDLTKQFLPQTSRTECSQSAPLPSVLVSVSSTISTSFRSAISNAAPLAETPSQFQKIVRSSGVWGLRSDSRSWMAPVLRWVLRWYGAAGFVVDLKNELILGCTGALP